MRASEIHAATKECLGHELNWSSVKNALSEHARRPEGIVRRTEHGVYDVRADAWEAPHDLPGP